MRNKKTTSQSTTGGDTLSRRSFVKHTAALGLGAAAAPYIVPASAVGAGKKKAPSGKIAMGVIGTGSQGSSDMRHFLRFEDDVQVVAVCDVDKERRDEAKDGVNEAYENKGCKAYGDFRELLERKDLDAVLIAVPDHWHSIPAIAAANRGLDIYAEKPLALTVAEGRAMVDAVKKNKVVWQTGSWQRSQTHFRKACELVRSGRIGEVHTVRVGLPTGSSCAPQPEMPIPDGFDYDFWLGPAPYAYYTEKRCHWNFRWILDYSGGQLTDWGAHHCDIANWGMGTEHTGPIEVEGTGIFPKEGLWDAATDYYVFARYGKNQSPVSPNGFNMLVSNANPMGVRFEGTDGWIHVHRRGMTTSPKSLADSEIGPDDVRLYEMQTWDPANEKVSTNHFKNFLDCVKSREETIAPIEAAHRAITIAHLGNIAMQSGRRIEWDPENEKILNDHITNRMLTREMRGDWHIV